MTGSARGLLEAVHEQLLVDVKELAINVEQLQAQIPRITADIDGSADGVKAAANQARDDFEAMGHALINVLRREVEDGRVASLKANAAAANATKAALDQYTKYFWLLSGLAAMNLLLVAVLLVGR